MSARPLVSVYSDKNEPTGDQIKLPSVFRAPIRPDIVNFVHDQLHRNKRQAYAVSTKAGHQTSAESWGTGRAVARIPRVRGGGTHRSGQGAFGNMCRGGHMYSPTKVWRRWHRHVNLNQRRYAMVSAIAATAVPSLVMARGHLIDQVPEIPLVISDKIEEYKKTKEAVGMLRKIKAYDDVERAKDTTRQRAGKGKMRNRRWKHKLGPLVVYGNDNGIVKAFRNLPGVDLVNVERLNVLKLAPGGHLGRFVIWTESAFRKLDSLYGSFTRLSKNKTGYRLPRPKMTNADVQRILRSEEVTKAMAAPEKKRKEVKHRRNPLKNITVMKRLNPYAEVLKRAMVLRQMQAAEKKVGAKRPAEAAKTVPVKKAKKAAK